MNFSIIKMLFCKNIIHKNELDITYHSNTDISSVYIDNIRKKDKPDMYYEITKDIRNIKQLSPDQINYIKTLPKEKIIEIIELYNECIYKINQIILKL